MVTIEEHENLTFKCHAHGRPTPFISWFRRTNRTEQDSFLLINDTHGEYHMINVNRSQTGQYECRASNGVNGHVLSKQFELRVLCK